jgi:hypothetical protein
VGEPRIVLRLLTFLLWPIPILIVLHIRRPSQITFDQTGLRVTLGRKERSRSWSDLVSWTERGGLLTLEFDKRRLLTFPVRDLSGPASEEFRRFLPSKS